MPTDTPHENSLGKTGDYPRLLADIKERVRSAQYEALKVVNKELVGLYWDIGRMIVERQADAKHGSAIAEQLSKDLRAEFPGIGAFFPTQHLLYAGVLSALLRRQASATIGCTNRLDPQPGHSSALQGPPGKRFYIRMTRKFGWSKNVLIHQIENQSYEKSLLGQTNFDQALTPELRAQAKLAVRDDYTFDFLELGEKHSERELERELIRRIEDFLRSMGGMFAFMGSQYRLEVDGKEFFIDLVLFHRRLRCLVAIELKIGEFLPEFVGKMQFYLTALDRQVRQEDENPSTSELFSAKRKTARLWNMLHDARKPIGVATYEITKTLPQSLEVTAGNIKLLEDI